MQLNVMTYNIASGRYYRNDADFTPNGSTRVVDLSKCADVIREIDPDFCGINEINHYKDEYVKTCIPVGTPADQTPFLAEYTGLQHFFFCTAFQFDRGDYGNALISKYPILEAEVIPIPDPEIKDDFGYYETRGILKAKLDIAGGVTLLQVHVGLNISENQNAVTTLCNIIDLTEGPVVLMGDFNMRPDNFLLDRIRARLQDICPTEPGYHHTFPSWPQDAQVPEQLRKYRCCKIDYIFASHHFRQLDCRVHQVRVSDHMPLIATLELNV